MQGPNWCEREPFTLSTQIGTTALSRSDLARTRAGETASRTMGPTRVLGALRGAFSAFDEV